MTLLSICIPTYNRAKYLKVSLDRITQEDIFLNTDKIEIVISDNASEDNTQEVCEKYIQQFPDKIRYNRNLENIKDKNFPLVLNMANGKFAKLQNDTVYFRKGGLEKILITIEKNFDCNAIYFSNGDVKGIDNYIECNNANELYSIAHHWLTWSSGLCIKAEEYKKLEDPMRFSDLNFAQTDIVLRLTKDSKTILVNEKLMNTFYIPNKVMYNPAEVFGYNYLTIIKTLIKEKVLNPCAFDDIYLKEELAFLNSMYFDFHKCSNKKRKNDGYFKYTLMYYKNKPYFWISYLKCLILKVIFIPYKSNVRANNYKKIGYVSQKISDFLDNVLWKRNNRYNDVRLKEPKNEKFVIVGKNSKGLIDLIYYGNYPTEKLYIGNNVIIGKNVKFNLSTANENEQPEDVMFDEGKNKEIVIGDNVVINDNSIINAEIVLENK